MKTIGDNIRYYRNLKSWSQEVMADKLDVSLATYSRLERNLDSMPFNRILQISKVFGISPAELVTFGKNKNDFANENKELKKIIVEKEKEIMALQKRIIELLDKRK